VNVFGRIGSWFSNLFGASKPKPLIICPPSLRSQFDIQFAEAQRRLGRKWKGEILTVEARPGRPCDSGIYWGHSPELGRTVAAYAILTRREQRIVCFVNPLGRETDAEMLHECAHCILASHGIDLGPAQATHHGIMRAAGIPVTV
jgi:hypothetical protein